VTLLAGLVPVFLLIALGMAARRFGMLNKAAADGLNALVANFALPALFIIKVGASPLESAFSPRTMLVTVVVTAIATVAGLGIAWWWGLPGPQRGVFAQGALRGNIVYFTFPLILATYGDAGLRLAAVTSTVLIPAMNLLAVGALEAYRPRGASRVPIAVRVLANPLVVGALLGLALAIAHWKPWGWLAASLNALADLAFPGALLALGAELEFGRIAALWRPLAAVSAIKLIAMPALGWWLLSLLGASPLECAVGVLLLAAPTAVASNSVAADLGGDTDLAGACVLATTVLSVATYVGWVVLLGG
jgi:predicted permease